MLGPCSKKAQRPTLGGECDAKSVADGSFLLTFAYAENAEGRKEFPACHSAFERLIANLHTQIEDVNVSIKDESERMMGPEINPAVVPPASGPEEEEQRAAEFQRLIDERLARGQPVIVRRQKEVDDLMTAVSMVWIMYMRFARRAEVSADLEVALTSGDQSSSGGLQQGSQVSFCFLAGL